MESSSSTILQELRAGRLFQDGTTLRADTRKGLIRVVKTEGGLISFQWKERSLTQPNLEPETDIILFPDEATFSKVPNSTSRSYMLTFAETGRTSLFFWMQEPKADGDSEKAASLSASLNSFVPDEDDAMATGDEAEPAGTSAIPTSTDEQSRIQASQLAHALRSIGMAGGMQQGELDTARLLAAMQQQREQPPGPSLSQVLKPELLLPILRHPDLLQSLSEHLPEGQRTQQHLEKLVTSAQFRHQLDVFSSALRSGQLDLAHFGLQGQGSSVLDFLKGIQKQFGPQ